MPTTETEFEEDTAFERYVLDRALPLIPRADGTSVIHLGDFDSTSAMAQPPSVQVGASDHLGGRREVLTLDDARPLLFGAAWKVLDLLIDLGLEQQHVPPDSGSRYSIKTKVRIASAGHVAPLSPFDGRGDLWSRVMNLYASTKVLRHSLVHRRLVIAPATGDIAGVAVAGEAPARPLKAAEESAFCRVSLGVADAVIEGELSARRANQLSWLLDQLAAHHGQPSLGASEVTGVIPCVIVCVTPGIGNEVTLNLTLVAGRARAAVGGVSHYDLEIHLPDGRVLAGPLEETPSGPATFSVAAPPQWLRWL